MITENKMPFGVSTAQCSEALRTGELGTGRAVDASRQLARVWRIIAEALDGDIASLARSGLLVCIPAHASLAMVGEK